MTAIPFQQEIYYPESDGQPMAESDLHRKEMSYLIDSLDDHFAQVPDIYVAGNLFLYYVKGDPRSVVAPDTFVVKGVPKRDRKVYKLWEEGGKVPCLAVEVTSDTTRDEDLEKKMSLYERLGVEEYFLFDPLGDYLAPRLQGYRLVRGRYQPLSSRNGSLTSQTTGVTFALEGKHIRLIETATGNPLLRREELRDENARLRAEIERLRKT
ncbi:MAG TPA: Uma2 family endonuclease [Thermoanaerobaculia bacterium]